MPLLDNDGGYANKVIVWISQRIDKRQWSRESKVYSWNLHVRNTFSCKNKLYSDLETNKESENFCLQNTCLFGSPMSLDTMWQLEHRYPFGRKRVRAEGLK